jgi:hypothetical protein
MPAPPRQDTRAERYGEPVQRQVEREHAKGHGCHRPATLQPDQDNDGYESDVCQEEYRTQNPEATGGGRERSAEDGHDEKIGTGRGEQRHGSRHAQDDLESPTSKDAELPSVRAAARELMERSTAEMIGARTIAMPVRVEAAAYQPTSTSLARKAMRLTSAVPYTVAVRPRHRTAGLRRQPARSGPCRP